MPSAAYTPSFKTLVWLALVLAVPAFMIHLGAVPFIEDESIRAMVAMEMQLKAGYLVPTMNTSLYFAKPPLYNWILICFYELLGGPSEWASRVPTVLFTALLAGLTYFFARSHFEDRRSPILAGFFVLTCGRILFWDSFLGLIDIFYSAVTFALFMLIYKWGRAGRWTAFYVSAYALTAVGYMLKGFPSFLFLGGSMLAFFVVDKRWRKVLHPSHLLGVLLLLVIVGGYYLAYAQASGEVAGSLAGLGRQSTMRTPITHGLSAVFTHLITYPFEVLYHFLPWTIFVVFGLRKKGIALLREQPFFAYVALCFLINISVYWVSPGVHPRYILMLIPLLFYLLLFFYEKEVADPSWRLRVVKYLFMAAVLGLPIAVFAGLWSAELEHVPQRLPLLWAGVLTMAACAVAYFYFRKQRPMLMVVTLLCLRIGFDLLVLPTRAATTYGSLAKEDAMRVGRSYAEKDFRLYQDSDLDYTGSFYLARERGQVTQRSVAELEQGVYYLLDTSRYELPLNSVVVDSLRKREYRHTLFVVQLRTD